MPYAKFQLGDLTFTVEASLKELAERQKLQREFNWAEHALQEVSGSGHVRLIYDTDLEGKQGTFDMLRLRSYSYEEELSYTIDLGTTDNNPLGLYPKKEIEVYDPNAEERWVLDYDGNPIEGDGSGEQGGSSQQNKSQNQNDSPPPQNDNGKKKPPEELLLAKIEDFAGGEEAYSVRVGQDRLPEKIKGLANYYDRDRQYLQRVLSVFEGAPQKFGVLAVAQARDAIRMIASEDVLSMFEAKQGQLDY